MNPLVATVLLTLTQNAAPETSLPEVATGDRPGLLVVDLDDVRGLAVSDLQSWDLDIACVSPETREVQIVCDAKDRELLESRRIPYHVLHEDLTAFYQSRLSQTPSATRSAHGAWLSPPFGTGSMGGYYTFTEVVSVLDQITAAYPNITTNKFSIATTSQGRAVWAVKVSDNPEVDENEPESRFDAVHHAREPESMQATLWFMLALLEGYGTDPLATYLVDNREIWFIPIVNPDGYVYNQTIDPDGGGMWRKNRRNNGGGSYGVDPNRNYSFLWGYDDSGSSPNRRSETYRGPSPASEPEVAGMEGFIDSRQFATASSAHTYSDLFLYPWGYANLLTPHDAEFEELSEIATEISGYIYGRCPAILYAANGTTIDYDYGAHGILSWTVEIGGSLDGFWPPTHRIIPLAEENEWTFKTVALAAGAFIREIDRTSTEIGDGDGHFEAGEGVEIRYFLRNSGMAAPTTPVVLTLTSPSPEITITQGNVNLGAMGSFTDADNSTQPLTFTINAGVPNGTAVLLTTAIEHEGYADTSTRTFLVGEGRAFISDDLEIEVGWTAGLPSDTATLGQWVHGDPVGTFNGSEPCNPEDDVTSDPGVNCYITGNGSTTAGGDQVNDGCTTLITPAIDLSDVGPAVLSYYRWFADLGSTEKEKFEVSISNDGGANWISLETVPRTENEWTKVEIVVEEYLAQTEDVRLRFVAEDPNQNSLVEAGIDELVVMIYETEPRFNVFGRPDIGEPIALHLTGDPGGNWAVYYSFAAANFTLPMVDGTILIDPATASLLIGGTIPADGVARTLVTLPDLPALVGMTVHLQGLRIGTTIQATNSDVIVFE
jgi:carboxypeptidase T